MQQVLSTSVLAPRQQSPRNPIPECDLKAHVEDDLMVNRIVNGRLVACRWNDLSEAERRAAEVVRNRPCEWW